MCWGPARGHPAGTSPGAVTDRTWPETDVTLVGEDHKKEIIRNVIQYKLFQVICKTDFQVDFSDVTLVCVDDYPDLLYITGVYVDDKCDFSDVSLVYEDDYLY